MKTSLPVVQGSIQIESQVEVVSKPVELPKLNDSCDLDDREPILKNGPSEITRKSSENDASCLQVHGQLLIKSFRAAGALKGFLFQTR